MLPPYLQPSPKNFTDGASFASAGAGVLVETNPGTVSASSFASIYVNAASFCVNEHLAQ